MLQIKCFRRAVARRGGLRRLSLLTGFFPRRELAVVDVHVSLHLLSSNGRMIASGVMCPRLFVTNQGGRKGMSQTGGNLLAR